MLATRMQFGVLKFLLLYAALSAAAFAGDPDRLSTNRSFFVQAMPFSGAQSLGFTGLTQAPIAAVAGANPATLMRFSAFTAGVEYQAMTETDVSAYVEDIKLRKVQPWGPSGIGLVVPMNNLRLGLGYRQTYSALIDYGEIEISTVEQPEGTGEFFHAVSKLAIHKASGMIAYTFNDVITNGDALSLGGQADWNYLYLREEIYRTTARAEDNGWSWKIGALYSIGNQIRLAFSYASGPHFDYIIKTDASFVVEDSSGFVSPAELAEQFGLPARAALGLSVQPFPFLRLSVTGEYVYWEKMRGELKNQWDLSAKMVVRINELLDVSAGMYGQHFAYHLPSIDNNATFIGAGICVKAEPVVLFLEVYDNHLSSTQEYRKQVVGRLGMEVGLGGM